MADPVFKGSFTEQEALPQAAIDAAVELMKTGRLHRYTVGGGGPSQAALLESEFAAAIGQDFCLAVASGGYALQLAMRAWGVSGDEPVLTNAFTLSPVPGAIAAVGGTPVLVETTPDLTIDLDDLAAKIAASGARLLLLSHMRGHITDMDALCALLDRTGVALIEDCAHTMGAAWDGRPSGTFGIAGCFSTQTYKHINSGEGGLIASNDATLMARATVLSGSYMLYGRHEAAPAPDAFGDAPLECPNMSGRMDNLRAAILRPQLATLADNAARWNARYDTVSEALRDVPGLRLTERDPREAFVGSSIQFFLDDLTADECEAFVAACHARGVELKWFGASKAAGYTSTHHHWAYLPPQQLPRTDAILATLFDMRLPLTFSRDDCALIASIIADCAAQFAEPFLPRAGVA